MLRDSTHQSPVLAFTAEGPPGQVQDQVEVLIRVCGIVRRSFILMRSKVTVFSLQPQINAEFAFRAYQLASLLLVVCIDNIY